MNKTFLTSLVILSMLILSSGIFSQVTPEWIKKYNHTATASDYARSICMDNNGNTYVAALSTEPSGPSTIILLKYNSSGVQQWVSNFNETQNNGSVTLGAIKFDGVSYLYVSGQYNDKILLIKYDLNGNRIWSKYYRQTNDSVGHSTGLIVSGQDEIYLTGIFSDLEYAIIVKYNAAGDAGLVIKYNDLQRSGEIITGIAKDNQSNIYAAARVTLNMNEYEYVLLKYSVNGTLIWNKKKYIGGNISVVPRMAVDSQGDIILGGSKENGSLNKDMYIVKYNSSGNLVMEKTINGTANSDDHINSIATDADNNICITGEITNNSTSTDCFVAKYSPNGSLIWSRSYDGNNNIDIGGRILIDYSGNLFISGSTYVSNTNGYDYLLLKYDANGNYKWAASYNGEGSNSDVVTGMTLNSNGDVIITGWSSGILDAEIITIKYSNVIGISSIGVGIPEKFSLSQNYPNPFNPVTNIKFDVPRSSFVKMAIFDMLGREIEVLVNQNMNAGTFNVDWDASAYPSGVYFYKIVSGDYSETKKMMLVK